MVRRFRIIEMCREADKSRDAVVKCTCGKQDATKPARAGMGKSDPVTVLATVTQTVQTQGTVTSTFTHTSTTYVPTDVPTAGLMKRTLEARAPKITKKPVS